MTWTSVVGSGDPNSALEVGDPSGTTNPGDVNVSGQFKVNGSPILSPIGNLLLTPSSNILMQINGGNYVGILDSTGTIAFGLNALATITSGVGFDNIGLGQLAGTNITTGTDNIVIGHVSGGSLVTGSNNIIIGNTVDAPSDTSNNLNIGNEITGILGSYISLANLLNVGAITGPAASAGDVNIATSLKINGVEVVGPNTIDNDGTYILLNQDIRCASGMGIIDGFTQLTIKGNGTLVLDPAGGVVSVPNVTLDVGSGINFSNAHAAGMTWESTICFYVDDASTRSNTGMGADALGAVYGGGGNGNTAVGLWALQHVTTGNNNTVIGSGIGRTIVAGSGNILIGENVSFALDTDDNLNIGNEITGILGDHIAFANIISTNGYTVATLPVSPLEGSRAFVTDALTPAFLTPLVGGGGIVCPAFYDGTNWIAG
jgi:hypothetical protein